MLKNATLAPEIGDFACRSKSSFTLAKMHGQETLIYQRIITIFFQRLLTLLFKDAIIIPVSEVRTEHHRSILPHF